MRKPRVYLCGPIDGVTPEWATEWRKATANALNDKYHIIDPTEDKDLYQPGANDTAYTPGQIVTADLISIRDSDILLVDWRQVPPKSISGRYDNQPMKVGTIMEMVYARNWGKRVITFGNLRRGYWARYHSDEHFEAWIDAMAYLLGYGAVTQQ